MIKKYPNILKRKRQIYEAYKKELSDLTWLTLPAEKEYAKSALHNYCVRLKNRDKLAAFLADKGIATTVHYIPNNHYRMYRSFRAEIPVTEKVWKEMLNLPFHAELSNNEIDQIINAIRKFKA